MTVKLLTEQHLEFLSLKGGCTGLSVSTLIKMSHCWKSHVSAQMLSILLSAEMFWKTQIRSSVPPDSSVGSVSSSD